MDETNQRLVINLSSKIGKLFKIVPLYEEKEKGIHTVESVTTNVESLIFELNGFRKRMKLEDTEIEDVLDILTAIKDEISKTNVQPVIRRESFKCIDIIHSMVKKIENGDGHE